MDEANISKMKGPTLEEPSIAQIAPSFLGRPNTGQVTSSRRIVQLTKGNAGIGNEITNKEKQNNKGLINLTSVR